jgi:phosphatidate cytidylyltransferase
MSKWADLKVRTFSALGLAAGFVLIVELGTIAFTILLVIASAILLKEWWGLCRHSKTKLSSMAGGTLYILLGAASLWFINTVYYAKDFNLIYALVIQVAAIDIGGYIVGKLFGKHKLAPLISPGKTWEGFAGSIVFSAACVYILRSLFDKSVDIATAFEVGFLFAAAALAGDLFESRAKRKAGVKDSGNIIPGHGGLFDRMDGLLACAIVLASGPISIALILLLMSHT